MYERIVRQMAFMGREASGTAVLSSALCKSSDQSFPWQSRCSQRRSLSRELRVQSQLLGAPLLPDFGRSGIFEKLAAYSSKLLRRDLVSSNIRPQHFRNNHAPIGLLIILHNRDPRPSHRQPAAVQSMYKFRFVFALRTEPDIRPPRLVRLEIRARRNLAIQLLTRQPDFNIVRLRRRWPHVARAQRHRSVMQPEFLQNFFGMP